MILYKLVILGDGGVGKTALTIQLYLNHFVETYDPTIEDSYRKQAVIDQQACILEVLDTAGQEEYTTMRDQWIRDGEGVILVYSITSWKSFKKIRTLYSQVQRVKESGHQHSPTGANCLPTPVSGQPTHARPVPVMLVGNKSDKRHEREVSAQEGQALAKELGCEFVEASAKNCINVEKAFYDVVRQLRRQRQAPLRQVDSSKGSTCGTSPDPRHQPAYREHTKRRGIKCIIL
ncbi:Ras family, other [Exophiala aquamarina CBS 119918]|uniref:Ras family, other n=1 Tax=Exophiala aquamarina CBS 119918 TaxID=1182545 RepID=A0A072NSQ9_9EURO|nr:Ras family, other [Exophiala aquamarina CBS 119918]KEF50894.1 Ras family, other [Exophiala aquamarina CBS 119918]